MSLLEHFIAKDKPASIPVEAARFVPASQPPPKQEDPDTGDPVDPSQFAKVLRVKVSGKSSEIEKFEEIIESLIAVPEEFRLKAALSVSEKTLQISKPVLIAAYDQRARLLNGEVDNFRSSLEAQSKADASRLSGDIEGLNSAIQTKNRELSDLTAQRDSLNQKISALKFKRDRVERDFNAAVDSLRTEFQTGSQRLLQA